MEAIHLLISNIEKVIIGKRPVIELAVVSLLCRGHVLLEDVPGTGKTMLARALSRSVNVEMKRLQCTPDLLPSDITGVPIYNQKTSDFEFRAGPVFTHILLADEINRATPRAQSALLECMEEFRVSVDGISYELPKVFMVLATQNPIDMAGTHPLPEAQLDRFFVRLHVGYPTLDEEIRILAAQAQAHPIDSLTPVIDDTEILTAREAADEFGNLERTFKPNEFAVDAAYSRLFSENFSGGIAFRFIYSNLTGGAYSGGVATKAGTSFAADISGYYQNDISLFNKNGLLGFGVNFSNIGSKMSYSDDQTSDFIPMNLRIGTSGTVFLDSYNSITLSLDLNKLLVPTPPIYSTSVPDSIIDGKDPNVSVPVAIFQSFYDAPGGLKEELHEITYSMGLEYWYNNQFALRGGYFHENETKGNRKYFTAGAGFRLSAFTLDFSYLIPLAQNHPLARTLRFSLAFDFSSLRNAGKAKG